MKRKRFLLTFSLFQFALFIPLAWWVCKYPFSSIELTVIRSFQGRRSTLSHKAVKAFSALVGSPPLLNVLVIPVAVLLWKRHWRLEALLTVGISWSNALIRLLIKKLVHRPRPSTWLSPDGAHKKARSFPSNHVCAAINFWGWLAAIGLLRESAPRSKMLAACAALCLLCIGPSRVYLGKHWATDVLGGYLFGGGWLGLFLQLYIIVLKKNMTI